MIWIVIRTIVSFVELCIYLGVVKCFCHKRSMPIYKATSIFLVGFGIISIFVSMVPLNGLRVVIVTIMYGIMAHILHEGSIMKKVGITLGFLVSVVVAEALAVLSVPNIELITEVNDIHTNTIMILMGITAKMIQLIGVNVLTRVRNKRDIPPRWSEFFIYIANVGTLLIINLFIRYETDKYQPMPHLIAVVCVCGALLVSNVFVWLMFQKIREQDRERRLYEEMQEKVQNQYQYYRNIEVRQEESRKMWHDINNHLNCIRHLIYTGHAEEANEYLNSIDTTINRLRGNINTGNLIVDAILNDKYEIAQNNSINIKIDVDLLGAGFVQNIDMCTIFSNLVDNALEACMKQSKSPREIIITAKTVKEFIIIKVINTTDNKVEVSNNYIKTTKKDKHNHGIGIRNVSETVEKYDGVLSIKSKEDQFVVHIALPCR